MAGWLDQFAAWGAHEAAIRQAEQSHARISEQADRAQADYRAALAEHRERVREAARVGGDVPRDIPRPSEAHREAVRLSVAAVMAAKADTSVLADLAPDVEARAAEDIGEALDGAREHVAALADLAAQVTEVLTVVARCRAAVEQRDGVTVRPLPSSRLVTHLGAGDLVAQVEADASAGQLLTPGPSPRPLLGFSWDGQPRPGLIVDDNPPPTDEDAEDELTVDAAQPSDGGAEARALAGLPTHESWPTTTRPRDGEI